MKWFKHETDAHLNMKLQSVIDKFGLEAYGYYWICVELVGLQGENFRLKSEKNWKNYIKKFLGVEVEKQEMWLEFFSEVNLIDKKALQLVILSIPKMKERSDDYTKYKRRVSEAPTKNIRLEESREEEKRVEKKQITLPDWIDTKVWNSWVQYRKEKKKSLTQRSIELQLKELEKDIPRHVEILEQSIRNGWAGLFPLRDPPKNITKTTHRI